MAHTTPPWLVHTEPRVVITLDVDPAALGITPPDLDTRDALLRIKEAVKQLPSHLPWNADSVRISVTNEHGDPIICTEEGPCYCYQHLDGYLEGVEDGKAGRNKYDLAE